MEDLFRQAAADVVKEAGGEPAPIPEEEAPSILEQAGDLASRSIQGATDLWKSVGTGMVKAGFETKDFLVGEPEDDEKSQLRKEVEGISDDLRSRSAFNGVVESISQFTTGMIGVGKLMAPIKAVQKVKTAGALGRVAYETARGAVTGAVAIDPHEERLSNLIQEFEVLENPVTEFLAADPDDSAALGRLKNSLEGIGLDLAIAGTFIASIRAIKHFRAGDEKAAVKALKQAERLSVEESAPAPVVKDPASVSMPKAQPLEVEPVGTPVETPAAAPNPDAPMPRAEPLEVAPAEGVQMPKAQQLEVDQVGSIAKGVSADEAVPDYIPKVELTDDDIAEIVKSSQDDIAAVTKYGSREEAKAAGHKFASSNLPWQKINSTEDATALIDNAASVLRDQMDTVKGGAVLSDAAVSKMVKRSAELFGEDPAAMMGELAKAGDAAKDMVVNMEASYIIARRMFEDAHDAAVKVRLGMFDELGGTPEAAAEEVRRRFQAAADAIAQGSSMRSAAGRSMRRLRDEFAITSEDVEAFRSIPADMLVDVLYKTNGDLKKLRQAATVSFWRRLTDEATFLLTNNLLWFYPTHIVNTTTNLYMLAARPTEKLIGGVLKGSGGSTIRKQAIQEFAYTSHSIGDAWSAMVDAFKRGDSVLNPHNTEYFNYGSRVNNPEIQWKPMENVWDLLQNAYMAANYRTIVGLPTRSLGAVDEFMKTLRYRSVVQARASLEATENGLKGADFKAHLQKRMDEAFTPDGKAVDTAALSEAQIATFQQELLSGTVGAGIRNFRHNVPATALVLPFIKTPVNVLRYAWKMTPGLNLLQTEYRQMIKGTLGPEAQAHALGQMALGGTFMAVASQMAIGGRITGGGPADNKLKNELLATGWQPYSIILEGEDGEKTYVPIGRFDPLGMPLGMVADLVDMMIINPDTREAQKGMTAVGVALAKAFSEKTFLLNMNQLLRAITEPEKNMDKFGGNLLGNLVPGSSALRNYANSDPYLREARSLLDQSMKGLPGYSSTLPPRRDSFGEPVWRKRSLTTDQNLDVVEAEHNRIITETGFGVRPPAATRHGLDLRDVMLSDGRNAYDLMQELAAHPPSAKMSLKAALSKLIQSDKYQDLVDGDPVLKGTKLGALFDIVRKYRDAGFKTMLKKYPELRTQIYKRQLEVKSEVSRNRKDKKQNKGPVEEILQSLGY